MLRYATIGNGPQNMKITVVAHPNAKNPRIEKDLQGTIHVYIHEPPTEGKANNAIITALAVYYGVKQNRVTQLSGFRGKTKRFAIAQ